jgi:hypothetical protein
MEAQTPHFNSEDLPGGRDVRLSANFYNLLVEHPILECNTNYVDAIRQFADGYLEAGAGNATQAVDHLALKGDQFRRSDPGESAINLNKHR